MERDGRVGIGSYIGCKVEKLRVGNCVLRRGRCSNGKVKDFLTESS